MPMPSSSARLVSANGKAATFRLHGLSPDVTPGVHSAPQGFEKVRVGFVMHVMQVAGAEVLVKQIIQQLGDWIEPTVLCLDDVGQLGYELRQAGVPVVVLDRKPGLDRRVAKRLAVEVKRRGIEVLHAHQYTPFFYSALARLVHRCRARVLFTEHGRHYPDVVSWKRHWANRLVLQRFADLSTGCCDFSSEALRTIEGFPRAITLRNGVDLSGLLARGDQSQQRALRQRLGLDPDRPYVACIARFHPIKDHATLIRAWARVNSTIPDARLLLVGDGQERQACQQLCRQLEITGAVEFWGIRGDVADILRAIDVFTLTSISEAASLTLLEAMASECPAVVTDVGGNSEHVSDAVEGYLVPRGDDAAVATRLIELLSNPERAREMGRSARQRVFKQFDLADVIRAYGDHYQSLAGRTLPEAAPTSCQHQTASR